MDRLDPEDWEVYAFYKRVENQAVAIGDIPVGLRLTDLFIACLLSGHPKEKWNELVDGAQFLFDRLVVKSLMTKLKQKRRHGGRSRRSSLSSRR